MFRDNTSSAQAQMIKCKSCGETMNAVYSEEARDTCSPCGGTSKMDSKNKQRNLTREKKAKAS